MNQCYPSRVWTGMIPKAAINPSNRSAAARNPAGARPFAELFSRFSRGVSAVTAHPLTFAAAVAAIVLWAALGPLTHYSDDWQLWINTSTTILTFLMVFVLQNAQVRDTRALHLKLDELLRAMKGARNELIDLENLSEAELERYCTEFRRLHRMYSKAILRKRTNVPAAARKE
ncbi:MAG TPA: low affinity iron permease family protein [Acidobacteriota bacterium]|nr:low affinity iron permease family protein [Acidobacteriota bacterium]